MSGEQSKPAAQTGARGLQSQTKVSEFDGCVPGEVTTVKVMSERERDAVWDQLYKLAGIDGQANEFKKSLRCALFVYFANNGTSPKSGLEGVATSGKGTVLHMPETIKAFSDKLARRRFMRANAEESVAFGRATGVYTTLDAVRQRCEEAGVHIGDCLAVLDWLDVYPYLTATEKVAQMGLKSVNIAKARRDRADRDEGVSSAHVTNVMRASGAPTSELEEF